MTKPYFPTNRYRLLRTNFTDTHPLVIDTEAKAEDIQSAANALYLLVQDGCDLLEAAQHVQLQPEQPQI